jgi:hypothetical protein
LSSREILAGSGLRKTFIKGERAVRPRRNALLLTISPRCTIDDTGFKKVPRFLTSFKNSFYFHYASPVTVRFELNPLVWSFLSGLGFIGIPSLCYNFKKSGDSNPTFALSLENPLK